MYNRQNLIVVVAVALLAGLAGPVAAVAFAPPPASGGVVLVIGFQAQDAVVRAGGRQVGMASAPFAVLAAGDGDFMWRLRQNGAWRVTGADWLDSTCQANSR